MLPTSEGLKPRGAVSPVTEPLLFSAVPPVSVLPEHRQQQYHHSSNNNGKRSGPSSSLNPARWFRSLEQRQRNAITLCAVIVLSSVLAVLAVAGIVATREDPDVPRNAAGLSLDDWKVVLERRAKHSAPPHESLGLSQVVFVSCNRHDRSQSYWAYVAAATQCEMVPTDLRARSAPCRRLYAGRSPLITAAPPPPPQPTTTGRSKAGGGVPAVAPAPPPAADLLSVETVPIGACGSVADSPVSLEYRTEAKPVAWRLAMQAATSVLRRRQIFYPSAISAGGGGVQGRRLSPWGMASLSRPPVDGLVWLGDAIYADKKADGKRAQSSGHTLYSLPTVAKFWQTQRDAPMYDAFRGSCLRRGTTAPTQEGTEDDDDDEKKGRGKGGNGLGITGLDLTDVNPEIISWAADLAHKLSAWISFGGEETVAGDSDGELKTVNGAQPGGDEVEVKSEADYDNEEGVKIQVGIDDVRRAIEKTLRDTKNRMQATGGGTPTPLDPSQPHVNIIQDIIAQFGDVEAGMGVLEQLVLFLVDDGNEGDGEGAVPEGLRGGKHAEAEYELDNLLQDIKEEEELLLLEREAAVAVTPPTPTSARPNVFGTWDDHDMGENDAGVEYPHKATTQQYFLDFLQAPADDERWSRAGVYAFQAISFTDVFMADTISTAEVFGGNQRDTQRVGEMSAAYAAALQTAYASAVCLVLLDVRSFRERPDAGLGGDMLGEAQWLWLEHRIASDLAPDEHGRARCALTLIGTGIQLIADEKTAENWAAFPKSRDRLFGLLAHYRIERVAFITGDVHMGELAADFSPLAVRRVLGYPIVEATSSGLTHSAAVFPGVGPVLKAMFLSPRRRVGSLYMGRNFGAARLSLDGALAMQNLEEVAATQARLEGLPPNSPTAAGEHKRLRAVLESAVNVTFTIFAIPKRGQPVLRLNFPLAMLTYDGAGRYEAAKVTPTRGYVYPSLVTGPVVGSSSSGATVKAAEVSIPVSFGASTVTVAHYPNNAAPVFTAYIRFMQGTFFYSHSVSETILALITIHKWIAAVALIAGVVYVCKRRAHMRRRGGKAARSPAGPATGLEETAASAAAAISGWMGGKRKEG